MEIRKCEKDNTSYKMLHCLCMGKTWSKVQRGVVPTFQWFFLSQLSHACESMTITKRQHKCVPPMGLVTKHKLNIIISLNIDRLIWDDRSKRMHMPPKTSLTPSFVGVRCNGPLVGLKAPLVFEEALLTCIGCVQRR